MKGANQADDCCAPVLFSRYTAVGRKEILIFFYLYALLQFLAMFLDTGIIPTSSGVYAVSQTSCVQTLDPKKNG